MDQKQIDIELERHTKDFYRDVNAMLFKGRYEIISRDKSTIWFREMIEINTQYLMVFNHFKSKRK